MSETAFFTPACLVLEDGRVFRGRRFGANVDAVGEVVFNTCMAGYPEVITDPSYAGQIVTMTYPMIGNYGVTSEDHESRRAFLSAFIVKEVSRIPSNWRNEQSLPAYLAEQKVTGLCDLDTRALVRHLRDKGALRGVVADANRPVEELKQLACDHPSMVGADFASKVTCKEPYPWTQASGELVRPQGPEPATFDVVVVDFGVKRNILRQLVDIGCRVTVVPASTSAEAILAMRPSGVMLSNGPGDPEPVSYAIETIRNLLGKVPVFGICLGHQLLCLASGAKTYKLKFGHHGGNHPVMDMATRKVEITSHNHGFAVDADALPSHLEITHLNLNDNTVEGIRHLEVPAFGVQYHPEAAPGPHDAAYLFHRFRQLMVDWALENGCHGETT